MLLKLLEVKACELMKLRVLKTSLIKGRFIVLKEQYLSKYLITVIKMDFLSS